MPLSVKNTLIGALTALSLGSTLAVPANAFGRDERNFIKGAAAAVIVGSVILGANRSNQAHAASPYVVAPATTFADRSYRGDDHRYKRNVRPAPVYRQHTYHPPVYRPPVYSQPVYKPRYHTGTVNSISIYRSAAAQAFNSYSHAERREIQRKLARRGLYGGGIDGAFGPGTYRAIHAFARARNREDALATRSGAFALMDSILS